ncbi:MAG: tetratricopeptide repeat protein [Bacteroidia bacterium]
MIRHTLILLFLLAFSWAQAQNEDANLFSDVKSQEFHYYLQQADSLYAVKKYDRAIALYKNCLTSLKASDKKYIIQHKIGNSFRNMAEYDSAVHYLMLSLNTNQTNTNYVIKTKSSLGVVYSRTKDYDLAKKYLQEVHDYYLKEGKDSVAIVNALTDLGAVYFSEEDYAKAIELFKQTLPHVSSSDKIGLSTAFGNIGTAFFEMQKLDSAELYIKKSLKVSRESNDVEGVVINLNNLAYFEQTKGNYHKAIPYYTESLVLSDSLKTPYYKKYILENMSGAYDSIGNHTLALKYLQQAMETYKKIYTKEKTEAIAEMQEKYEAAEREKQIAELKLQKQQDEAEKLALKNSIVFGVFIAIIIAIIGWLRVMKIRNEKNLAVVSAAVDAQEQERERISQEIHDDLGGVLGMARMLHGNTKNMVASVDEELYQRIDDLLVHANKRSRAISHELFSPTLRMFGIEKAILEVKNSFLSVYPKSVFYVKCAIPENTLDKTLELNIYRIVQELVNNCIKYAEATEITLKVSDDKKNVYLYYKDNGKGFDAKTMKHGVGLLSITSRVKRYGGKLEIHSKPNEGTEVVLSLNKKFAKKSLLTKKQQEVLN